MATTFKYQAKDASGRTVSGTVTANTQTDVVADLRRRALTPIQIKKASGGSLFAGRKSSASGGKKRFAKKSSVKKGELEVFTRQLSTMLGAGIPMLEGLEILADEVACNHGATVGQLDDTALYYLRSRGIAADEARRILINGFANQAVADVGIETLRAWITHRLGHHDD